MMARTSSRYAWATDDIAWPDGSVGDREDPPQPAWTASASSKAGHVRDVIGLTLGAIVSGIVTCGRDAVNTAVALAHHGRRRTLANRAGGNRCVRQRGL